jgi:hypothetical protein
MDILYALRFGFRFFKRDRRDTRDIKDFRDIAILLATTA